MRPTLTLALAMAAVLAVPWPARADIGPKPTAAFAVSFDRPGITITGGELLQCRDAACADAKPLQALGPQRFGCEAAACSAMAYGFAPYGRLRIVLSDKRTVLSDVFAILPGLRRRRAIGSALALRLAANAASAGLGLLLPI